MRVNLKFNIWLHAHSHNAGWVLWTLWYNTFSYVLVYTFGLPRAFLYLGDALTLWTFLLALQKTGNRRIVIPREYSFFVAFLIVGIVSSLMNGAQIVSLLWGVRNNGRYLAFLYSAYVFLDMSDIERIRNFIIKLFYISFPLCIIERFFVSYPPGTLIGDRIGGIFWNYTGCNMPLNIILCVSMVSVTTAFFRNRESLKKFVLMSLAALIMAATAELKVFLVELIIIFVFCALIERKSVKNIAILVLMIIASSFVIDMFIAFNNRSGYDYAALFSISGFTEYLTRESGYTGAGDINRLTGVLTISRSIFENNTAKVLLGIGLGNAEYTNFFHSSFYAGYKYLHYYWFHMVWMFIETGALGVVCYVSGLLSILVKCLKGKQKEWNGIAGLLIIIMLLLYVYNLSLRSESAAYMLYSFLTIPFLLRKAEYEG